jgi:hypothetical protein
MTLWRSSSQSIAAYRSSYSAALTPNSLAAVLVCHERVLASLVFGAKTRAATACTCPCGSGSEDFEPRRERHQGLTAQRATHHINQRLRQVREIAEGTI